MGAGNKDGVASKIYGLYGPLLSGRLYRGRRGSVDESLEKLYPMLNPHRLIKMLSTKHAVHQ